MPQFTYSALRQQLLDAGSLPEVLATEPARDTGTFTGTVVLNIPQLKPIDLPMDDISFGSKLVGKTVDVDSLLGLKTGNGGKINNYGGVGSQIIISSDRVILNSKDNYLMLFGQEGVAISSPGNVNIDADDAVTIYGEDGLYLGVPGKGTTEGKVTKAPKTKAEATIDFDYEPLVLGLKLANLLEDLLVTLKSARVVSPVGLAYFREDTQSDLRELHARIPEILSTYAYLDGISHEIPNPAPDRPKEVTVPPTSITGTVSGTYVSSGNAFVPPDPNAASNVITNTLSENPDFYESNTLYNDPF
jgi:hypothetical protein